MTLSRFSLAACVLFILSSLVAGCAPTWIHPYCPPVQQGNVLDQAALSQLRIGMTAAQVQKLLGSCMLVDTFQPDHWTYIYSYRPSRGTYQQKQASLYFHNGRLIRVVI